MLIRGFRHGVPTPACEIIDSINAKSFLQRLHVCAEFLSQMFAFSAFSFFEGRKYKNRKLGGELGGSQIKSYTLVNENYVTKPGRFNGGRRHEICLRDLHSDTCDPEIVKMSLRGSYKNWISNSIGGGKKIQMPYSGFSHPIYYLYVNHIS